jgi:hypothetical protein
MSKEITLTSMFVVKYANVIVANHGKRVREMTTELEALIESKCKEQRDICARECKMKETNGIWTPDFDSIRNAPSPTD